MLNTWIMLIFTLLGPMLILNTVFRVYIKSCKKVNESYYFANKQYDCLQKSVLPMLKMNTSPCMKNEGSVELDIITGSPDYHILRLNIFKPNGF